MGKHRFAIERQKRFAASHAGRSTGGKHNRRDPRDFRLEGLHAV
jgi:hypothetical protein